MFVSCVRVDLRFVRIEAKGIGGPDLCDDILRAQSDSDTMLGEPIDDLAPAPLMTSSDDVDRMAQSV
jgi:hypothetical protein